MSKLLTRIFFIILITPALSYAAGPAGMYTDDEDITESDTPNYEKKRGSANLTQQEKDTKTTATPATTSPQQKELRTRLLGKKSPTKSKTQSAK